MYLIIAILIFALCDCLIYYICKRVLCLPDENPDENKVSEELKQIVSDRWLVIAMIAGVLLVAGTLLILLLYSE